MREKDKKKRLSLYGKLISLLIVLFLFVGLEGISRLLLDDTHLDQILDVLERDPVLFWRQKSNLRTVFANTQVWTDKRGLRISQNDIQNSIQHRAADLRMACLGGSPTFGWGVDNSDTYCTRLQHLLSEKLNLEIEVINAGQIGYSSHQGKLFLEKVIAPLQPDIISVSYVINDIDKYRFYRSNGRPDYELEPDNRILTATLRLLDDSRFVRLYGKALNYLFGNRTSFQGRPVEIYRPESVRVPPEQYRDNLSVIADLTSRRGVGLVFIKMPVNLPAAPELEQIDQETAEGFISRGETLVEQGKYHEAIEILSNATEEFPYLSEAYYFLGVCYKRLGDGQKAADAFSNTMKSEAHRCGRDGRHYNAVMQQVADEKDVLLIDVIEAFGQREGAYLFLSPQEDPIHPNKEGHRIIAECLSDAIATNSDRLYGDL